jgi:hypothetical protein
MKFPRKVIVGGLLTALVGCEQNHRNPRTVVVDEWWSNDYAVEAGWNQCRNFGNLTDGYCNSEQVKNGYRQEEAQFTEAFSTAFQADTACSGIALAVFRDPSDGRSQAAKIMAESNSYWSFQVNFQPGAKVQSWAMDLAPKHTHSSSGEGNASSIARTICSIVKGMGGSVAE